MSRLHQLITRRRDLDAEIHRLMQTRPETMPMHASEIAEHLGINVDTFYKTRERLRMVDGMPAPMAASGRPAWERSGMMAWLTRHHPLRPNAPANDLIAMPPAGTIAEHQAELHAYYEARKGTR